MTNTKPQHTPAPWDITEHEDKLYIGNLQSSELAVVCGTKANARLIAAAPELLEALDRLVTYYAGSGINTREFSEDLHPVNIARSAIAKARGEV